MEAIAREDERWTLRTASGPLHADAVVLSVDPATTRRLLEPVARDVSADLAEIPLVSVGVVPYGESPYTARVTIFVPVNARDRNSDSGSIGWRLRASTKTKATSDTRPTISGSRIVAEVQPAVGASMSA